MSERTGARVRAWTLQRGLLLVFILCLVLIVGAMTAAGFAFIRVLNANDTLLDHLAPARIAVDRLDRAYLSEQAALRDYALLGKSDQAGRYGEVRQEEDSALAELRMLLAADTELASEVENVTVQAGRWRTEVADPIVAWIETNGAGGSASAQVAEGNEQYSEVRTAISELRDAVDRANAAERATLRAALAILVAVAAGAVLATVACGIGLWTALRRGVTLPLLGLARETHKVARGDLDRMVQGSGPDEIRRLAADVDQMRQNLVTALAAALRAQEAAKAQAAQLAEQAEDLRRSNAELEQFAYVASHDLQEPLRKVASFCQMLERRYSGQLDERADQYIAFAVDGSKRMQLLINDLLAFSRVGRTTGEFKPVDLNTVLDRALTSLAARLEETGAQVESDPLPTVNGNPTLLAQVLQNLIGNAVKFRRPNTVPRVQIRVQPHSEGERPEWHFRCIDNGIGIEPRYAERIFVIFQRLHAKDEYEGTGIGLALCRKIIEHHSGKIWLDTERLDGTTVHWTLPALPAVDMPALTTQEDSGGR